MIDLDHNGLPVIGTKYEEVSDGNKGAMAPREVYLSLGSCAWVSVRPAWPREKPAQIHHRYCVDTQKRHIRHVPLNEAIRALVEDSAETCR